MALAGIPLGLEFVFLDPSAEACAGELGQLLQADFSDVAAARQMAAMVDVATFDFENVPHRIFFANQDCKTAQPRVIF